MRGSYEEYKTRVQEDIESCVQRLKSQPILFAGAGTSIRYFGGPSWDDLLEHLSESEAIDRSFEYHLQDKEHDMPKIGSEFAESYNKWAWDNKNEYPAWVFNRNAPKDIYIKYSISDYFSETAPDNLGEINNKYAEEIELLQEIQPHAVITTNYDQFLELVYPDYHPVVGEKLISEPYSYIGEIYKIHGCVSRPTEMVLTEEDYVDFIEEQRYLSAKLLTYFTEHPVLIVGYEPDDKNVKRILSDVKKVLDEYTSSNIFLVDYDPNIPDTGTFDQEKLIEVGDGEQMIVNYIRAADFEWIFDAFASGGEITGVNVKLLRRLMKNTFEIVTKDAPKREINFEQLKSSSEEKERLATLFGIAPLDGTGIDFSDQGVSVRLDDEGMPVDGIVTDDPVEDINAKLATAVSSWQSNGAVISERKPIYTFYHRRSELELDNRRSEFLLRSSFKNYLHGSVWIETFDGDTTQLLRDARNEIDGRSLTAYERVLLGLGKKEVLEEISEDDDWDFISSNASEYASLCGEDPLDRAMAYTGSSIKLNGQRHDVGDLFEDQDTIDELLDDVVNSLIQNDDEVKRASLRNIEMIKIATYSEITSN
ncbi:SIR2 family protein [Natrialbaceae archaeon A-CW1-1]